MRKAVGKPSSECPPNIPYFTWRMGQGFHPDGFVRCKHCGATDEKRICSYCKQGK